MANLNLKKLTELSVKYNVSFQPIYTDKAMEKGTLSTVHQAIIGGNKYTGLCGYNNTQLEELFKNIANGTDNSYIPMTSTRKSRKQSEAILKTNRNGQKVAYIGGRRYTMLDVLKGVSIKSLFDIMDNNKGKELYYTLGTWLEDWNNRLQYVRTLESKDFLTNMAWIECYLSSGERVVKLEELYEAIDRVATEWASQEGVRLIEDEETLDRLDRELARV